MEIQDSFFQILRPEKQELEFTKTFVYSEDTVSREYIVFDIDEKPELFNTQEAILNVNFKLNSTITKQERTVFDSFELVGNLGGLNEVLFRTLAPVVGLLIGNRFQFSLLSQLFWVSDGYETEN